MPVRRKIFRIEETMRTNTTRAAAVYSSAAPQFHARGPNPRETAMHGCAELCAIVTETEVSTHRILAAAEAIDRATSTLAAPMTAERGRAIAGDIRDHVTRIVEACHVQDLSGQRVAKVLALLQPEPQAPVAAPAPSAAMMNGPKLDGAPGHVTQADIDVMFGA